MAGLLVLAGCVAPLQIAPDEPTGDADPAAGTVVATGAGSVTADPDLVVLALAGVDSLAVGSQPIASTDVAERAVAAAGVGSTAFQPGPVTVSASVTVSSRTA